MSIRRRTAAYSYLGGTDFMSAAALPHGIGVTRAYEAQRNLLDYAGNSSGGTPASNYDYTSDSTARRTDVVMTGSAFAASTFNHYDYDDRSEIVAGSKYQGTDITDLSNPVTSYAYTYGYDPLGNRASHATSQGTTTYTTNSVNQYATVSGLSNPVHDQDGNMTLMPAAAGDWTLSWDAENRLVRAESSATAVEFEYDHLGRRTAKRVHTGGVGAWALQSDTRFVYDGWNLIAELAVQQSTITMARRFTWGMDASGSVHGAGGVGGVLGMFDIAAGALYVYAHDGNGNVSELFDSTGAVVAHYEYAPFGGATVSSGTLAGANPFRFSGKYLDADGGLNLYYYGHRYLSPALGRWLSRDPIAEEGGLLLYGFVGNDPANMIDPLGLAEVTGEGVKQIQSIWSATPMPFRLPLLVYWKGRALAGSELHQFCNANMAMGKRYPLDDYTNGFMATETTTGARVQGAYRAGMGTLESVFILGAIKTSGGLLLVVASTAEVDSLDNTVAGFRQLVTGERKEALIDQGIQAVCDEETAQLVIDARGCLRMPVAAAGAVNWATTPRELYHYTNSRGAAGIRAANRNLIPGPDAAGKVWATTIRPEQMFGGFGWFHRLRLGGGVNFRVGGRFGIGYVGQTQFTRYFVIQAPEEFSSALWSKEFWKGAPGFDQYFKTGAAPVK